MTITRHEYPLTPGRPIISRAVEHGGIVYVCGVTPDPVGESPGYAAIHGLPEGTAETTISEWRTRVHPEDLARAEGLVNKHLPVGGKRTTPSTASSSEPGRSDGSRDAAGFRTAKMGVRSGWLESI